jgi:LL-diaminopimelate aminotransferase
MNVQRADRLSRLSPLVFAEARRMVREARARGVDVISLGLGDPDQPPPAHVVEALTRAVANPGNHRYPTGGTKGMPRFCEAVASWYQRRFGVSLDPVTEVRALIGSKEGNHHLALGVLNPGDLVILSDPGYPVYESAAIIAGARVVHVPLRKENGFLLDFDEIPPYVARQAKLLWLNYPNNPTTAVAPLEFYERAVDFADRYGILLVNDNPYAEIAFDGIRVPSILEISGAREIAVEFNSLSKTYNMAGWRIGTAVGNAALIAAMAQVKESADVGIFDPVQHAAIAALEGPQDVIARNVATYRRRRDLVIETLHRVGIPAEPPKATFYVWAPVPVGMTSAEFVARLFELTGVLVTPGSGYGAHGEGFVRLSLGVPDDRLVEAMQRLRAVSVDLVQARTG